MQEEIDACTDKKVLQDLDDWMQKSRLRVVITKEEVLAELALGRGHEVWYHTTDVFTRKVVDALKKAQQEHGEEEIIVNKVVVTEKEVVVKKKVAKEKEPQEKKVELQNATKKKKEQPLNTQPDKTATSNKKDSKKSKKTQSKKEEKPITKTHKQTNNSQQAQATCFNAQEWVSSRTSRYVYLQSFKISTVNH